MDLDAVANLNYDTQGNMVPPDSSTLSEGEVNALLYSYEARIAELENRAAELKQSLEKASQYTDHYDFSPTAYFRIRRDGTLTELNHSAAGMLGNERLRLMSKNLRDFVAPAYLPGFDVFVAEVLSGPDKQNCFIRFITDPEAVIQLTGFKLADDDECRIAAFKLDALAADENAKENEFFFRETQRAAKIGSYKADFKAGFWESSQILDQIFGINKEYVRSIQNWLKLVHPDDQEMMETYLRENVMMNREPFQKEYRIIRKSDGNVRWVMGLGKAEFDATGEMVKLLGTIQDITERKKIEAALRESEKHFRTLADSGQAMIWTSDLEQKCSYVNKQWLDFMGTSLDQQMGSGWQQGVHPDDVSHMCKLAENAFIEQKRATIEYRLLNANQLYRWVKDDISPRYDSMGRFIGIIRYCTDITENKQMFELLENRVQTFASTPDKNTGLLFEELFDLNDIQAIQDAFADALGVASLISRPDGTPITQQSKFTLLCRDFVRKSEVGCARCMQSAALLGLPHASGPRVQQCISGGLWDAGTALVVGENYVANWLVGQVRNQDMDEGKILAFAEEIGADKDEFLKAFYQVPSMTREQFDKVARLLFLIAKKLSATAYQNMQQAKLISEQVKAGEKLRESETQFRNFFENAADAIFVADMDTHSIVDANHAASRLMQMPLEKIIGMHQSALHPQHNKDFSFRTFEKHKKEATQLNSTIPVENKVVRSNGSLVPVEVLSSLVTIRGKQYLMGTFRNIADRKFMETAIQESEKRYRNLAESSPYGIVVFQESQFVYVNPAGMRMLGAFESFELIGMPFLSVFRQQSRPDVAEWMKALLNGNMVAPREEMLLRLDGSLIDAEVVAISTTYNEKPAGQVIIRDITESKLAKEEIYKLNNELEQRVVERTAELEAVNKELESFSYSVSHDLRSPLRSIDGFANILLEDYSQALDAEAQRLLGVIIKNANKMGTLIDDLLSFSRLGRQEISSSHIDMYQMVRSVYDELLPGPGQKNIHFHLEPLPDANGDPSLIRQVWLNIIGNAIKYTSKKTSRIIDVSSFTQQGTTVYVVSDNGAGFNMEHSGKLFGVFQRLHSPKEFEGTGVGLATVQRIIQRHKGKIWAEGKVGEGAQFYFTLQPFKQ